mgnify:CR=1 FL=1
MKPTYASHPGKEDVANTRKKNRRDDDRPRAVTVDEITDERRFDRTLGAR